MLTEEEKITLIKSWLGEEGFEVTEVPDEKAVINLSVEAAGRIIAVVEKADQPDKVLLFSGMITPPEVQGSIMTLNEKKRGELLWSLRLGLLNMRVNSSPIAFPLKLNLVAAAYWDGLNKNVFMDKFQDLHRALLFVNWTIERTIEAENRNADLSYIG